jgi:hypothetical protein
MSVKSRVVSISEITAPDNKRLCLSALRYTGSCYKCPKFEDCESRIITPESEEVVKKIKELQEEKKGLKARLKKVDELLEKA